MSRSGRTENDSGDDSGKEQLGKTRVTGDRTTLLKRVSLKYGIDGAVGFAILARLWQLLTGPVTQLLLVWSFSKATQDYYYAFSSLPGMQIFVELSLHVVLISVSSHEG